MTRMRVVLIILLVVGLAIIGGGVWLLTADTDESQIPQYSMETRQALVDEAMARLEESGFGLSMIAALAYGVDDIELGFYGKANPEAVEIVESVIDELAPGMPLKIVENITIETQTITMFPDNSGLEKAMLYRVIGEENIINDDPDRSAGLWTILSEASGFEERAQTAARAAVDIFYLYKRDFTSVMLVPREGIRISYAQANFAADGKGAAGMTGSAPAAPGHWKIWSSDDKLSEQQLAIAELWFAKEQDFPQMNPLNSLSYDEEALKQYIADKLNIPYDEVKMPLPEMREYKLEESFIDRTVSNTPGIIHGNPGMEVALNQLPDSGNFTDSEKVVVDIRLNEVPEEIKNEFAEKYSTAEEVAGDSGWMIYSIWRPYTQSDEYRQILDFCRERGQEVWPLLFRQIDSGNRYFAGGVFLDLTLPEYVYYFEKDWNPDSGAPDAMSYFKELLAMID